MTAPLKSYSGTLRPRITPLGGNSTKVEWVNETDGSVVWVETCTPNDGFAFMSQIVCTGDFATQTSSYFIDTEGKRHFVLHAEEGRLGAAMGG